MLALSAIHAATKQGESPALSQHFSQEAYAKAFIVLDTISSSELPEPVKSALLARMDEYYDQIIKAKDLSAPIGRVVAKSAANQMVEIIDYLLNSLQYITDDHFLVMSIWNAMPPQSSYVRFRANMQNALVAIHRDLNIMIQVISQ